MSDERSEDETALAALGKVADRTTVRSFKQTFLAYFLIRAVRNPKNSRRRVLLTSLIGTASVTAADHWHVWTLLAHLHH